MNSFYESPVPGARQQPDGTIQFTLWAPLRKNVQLQVLQPFNQQFKMQLQNSGYWTTEVESRQPLLYKFLLDGTVARPDPASHFQPEGVHGPSQTVDHAQFDWQDQDWEGLPLQELVIYELHTGSFTGEGTFEAVVSKLDYLKSLGITAVELMPVAQFPGGRNWGYDGTYPYAVQNSYGGPAGLKMLVNACHKKGMAVILDVVYNHLGPEGNYLRDFGPYFTKKYHTPWGESLNFDSAWSDEVRRYFIGNALYWLRHYHIDALRLDAIHAIYDFSAKPFLQELAEEVDAFSARQGRSFFLIAESSLNDTRILLPREKGGFGIHAQWSDDFHHSLHTLLTGENSGYYLDYGRFGDLEKSIREGFIFDWRYSPFRRRRHGSSSAAIPGRQLVISIQNHDQIGNRLAGDRLSALVSFPALKAAAGLMLLSPYVPMLFMGEEYGETAPFLYFVSHGEAGLIQAVREGRKLEFESFLWQQEPPDPQSPETFNQSRLNWKLRDSGKNAALLEFYRTLLQLRREQPALSHLDKNKMTLHARESQRLLYMERHWNQNHLLIIISLHQQPQSAQLQLPAGNWRKLLDGAEERYGGDGKVLPDHLTGEDRFEIPPFTCAIYQRKD
ncbi:MAG: malto-oligosyltrehalose trehalohydrolase [Calditrichia bacterium]